MFKKHWMYDNIVPIYNISNLEEVIDKTNLEKYKTKSDSTKIFPVETITDKKISKKKFAKKEKLTKEQGIEIVIDELTPVNETNMEVVMNDMYNNR